MRHRESENTHGVCRLTRKNVVTEGVYKDMRWHGVMRVVYKTGLKICLYHQGEQKAMVRFGLDMIEVTRNDPDSLIEGWQSDEFKA